MGYLSQLLWLLLFWTFFNNMSKNILSCHYFTPLCTFSWVESMNQLRNITKLSFVLRSRNIKYDVVMIYKVMGLMFQWDISQHLSHPHVGHNTHTHPLVSSEILWLVCRKLFSAVCVSYKFHMWYCSKY